MGIGDSYLQGLQAGSFERQQDPGYNLGQSLGKGLASFGSEFATEALFGEQRRLQERQQLLQHGYIPVDQLPKELKPFGESVGHVLPPHSREPFVNLQLITQLQKTTALQHMQEVGRRQVRLTPQGPMMAGGLPTGLSTPPMGEAPQMGVPDQLPTVEDLRAIPAAYYSRQPHVPRLPFKTTPTGNIELQSGATLTATEAETARRLQKEMRTSAEEIAFKLDPDGTLVWKFPPTMNPASARIMSKIVSDQMAMTEPDKILFHQAVKDASDIGLGSAQRQQAAAMRDKIAEHYKQRVPIRLEQKPVDLPPKQVDTLDQFLEDVKKKAQGTP